MIASDRRSPGPLFVAAGIALLGCVMLVLLAPTIGSDLDGQRLQLLAAQLDTAAFALALVLAGMCLVRWRLVGEAAMLWFGTAMVFGLLSLALRYVLGSNVAIDERVLLLLHPASRLVAAGLIVKALLSPEVDAQIGPAKALVGAAAAMATLTVGFQLVPAAGQFLGPVSFGDQTLQPGLSAFFVAIWGTLAAWCIWRGLRRHRPMFAWFGLLLFAIAFAELVGHVPAPDGSLWLLGGSMLRVAGLLCAVTGATAELARAYVRQSGKLLESVTSERSATARVQAQLATQAERAHEARNALISIEGAIRTLQRHQEELDPQSRTELSNAVSSEVHRLQELVSASSSPREPGRFRVTEALAAIVTCARSQGSTVHVDVPGHLVAVGQPAATSQVLLNLFENARRYGRGTTTVWATLEDDEVVIRVEDDGPGISEEERTRIFARGVRGRAGEHVAGSGLGLYVSSKLMHDQGGSLRLEDRVGRGACFAVRLPGFSELASDDELAVDGAFAEEPFDEADERVQLVGRRERSVLPFPGNLQRRPGLVQDDGPIRDDALR